MCDIVMGHVRWATVGNVTEENAQPFVLDNLVGCHNGTLIDQKYQDKTGKKSDSLLFFEDVSRRGLKECLDELDEKSAYAIVLYDRISKNFVVTHNKRRPLWFALHKKSSVLYYASEFGALSYILHRNGIEADYFQLREGVIWVTNRRMIRPGKEIFEAAYQEVQEVQVVKDKGVSLVKEKPPWDRPLNSEGQGKFDFKKCCKCGTEMNLVSEYYARLNGRYDDTKDEYTCECILY